METERTYLDSTEKCKDSADVSWSCDHKALVNQYIDLVPSECHFGADKTLLGVSLTNTKLLDPEGKDTV